jgi:hypothetical protein
VGKVLFLPTFLIKKVVGYLAAADKKVKLAKKNFWSACGGQN